MLKTYCSDCGAPTEYSLNKPKFCSSCGGAFDKKVALPALKPKRTISKIQNPIQSESLDYIEDSEDTVDEIDHVPNISSIDYELSLPQKNKETIGNLIGTSNAGDEQNLDNLPKTKLNRKKFLEDFSKEAGSIRKGRRKNG